ncbi:MAG: lipoyl synthase [Myxococcota bacterium]
MSSPRPAWIRARYQQTPQLEHLLELVRSEKLHTVCQSAACPNLGECWAHGTATFMIAGNQCTRACGFCAVATGRPGPLDPGEPARVAHAIAQLGLKFAVVTAVARDDLDDGGAEHFARTIAAIRARAPGCKVEVLIPDLKGSVDALGVVLAASPDVLNHNLETVERLQRPVRKAGRYDRSLALLANSARLRPEIPTKTGLMLGLGETDGELRTTLRDIRAHGCRLLTIGQYLAPSSAHLPVARWVTPKEFDGWADFARELGFDEVFSGPLVRSSYRAEKLAQAVAPATPR